MKNKPLISVIVPVYNVEEFLERCITSIREQTYKNLEIILVNDGSTDRSGELCQQHATNDQRIRVINKSNGGLSDARNVALDVMRGEYVTFIDSDDWVSKYYVENLYTALVTSNSDISSSWFENVFEYKINEDTETNELIGLNIMTSEECLEKMLYQDGVETCATGKLYKTEIFENMRYPKGKLYEDIPITSCSVHKAEKIAVIKNVDYYYFQRKSGIQNQKFSLRKLDAVIHMKELKNFIEEKYPALRKAAMCRYFSVLNNILFQMNDNEYYEERKKLWKEIKKYRRIVLFDNKGRKKARVAAFLSYGGYKLTKFVYIKSQWRAFSR